MVARRKGKTVREWGFREGHQGDLACRHREVSCCPQCAAAHPEIVAVEGLHFWIDDPAERAALKAEMEGVS